LEKNKHDIGGGGRGSTATNHTLNIRPYGCTIRRERKTSLSAMLPLASLDNSDAIKFINTAEIG
jgi:hypothetical protein